jgi:hypothetical protein
MDAPELTAWLPGQACTMLQSGKVTAALEVVYHPRPSLLYMLQENTCRAVLQVQSLARLGWFLMAGTAAQQCAILLVLVRRFTHSLHVSRAYTCLQTISASAMS